jgi:sugar phosphate isomerase/epimerase
MLAKAVTLRKMYNDAGVNIHIHKCPFGSKEEDINFNFELAKALGCKAITTERSDSLAKKLAPYAEKHQIYVGFHNHTNDMPVIDKPDPLLDCGKYIMFNFDIGHYVAGSKGKSPIPVLEKYHDRIISLHLKDRTADGGNLPWGKGTTPIKEVLLLLKKEKWPIYADIELEYKIPAGSTSVAEVAKCVAYCKEVLA